MTTSEESSPVRRTLSPETLTAQALGAVDPVCGALVPPIHLSTTYERGPDGAYQSGRAYTRADNPTYDHAEQLLATLEAGAGCALFASGNAAATAVFQSLLPGDHVLVARVLYWGIRKWLAEFAVSWGLDVEFVDTADPAAVAAAIRPGRTRLLWLETPANPTWEITDLAAVAKIAHAADVRVAVDNTVATPVLTRPIEFGADLVVHSATKYLNGHSDVLAGAVVTARREPVLGADPLVAPQRRRGRGRLRGLAIAARDANSFPPRPTLLRDRTGPCPPLPRAPDGDDRSLSGTALASGPYHRRTTDDRRVWRNAIHQDRRR